MAGEVSYVEDDDGRLVRLISRHEQSFRRAFLEALGRVDANLVDTELIELLEEGLYAELLVRLEEIGDQIAETSRTAYLDAGREAARWVSSEALAVSIDFDPRNEWAIAAMEANDLRLVREYSVKQQVATRQALERGIARGDNPREQARAFRDSIGLTARQEAAVDRYRSLLEGTPSSEVFRRRLRDRRFDPSIRRAQQDETPLSQAHIDRMVTRYRERYIKYRSEVIARTEALRSVHQGTEELYDQALESGRIRSDEVEQTWLAASDSRVRDSHAHLNGQVRRLGETWKGLHGTLRYPGDPEAPAAETVQCRCAITTRIVPAQDSGLGTPGGIESTPPTPPPTRPPPAALPPTPVPGPDGEVEIDRMRFRPHPDAEGGVVVVVDASKLDAAWRQRDEAAGFYVQPGGDGKSTRFETWLAKNPGATIDAPFAGFDGGKPSFVDGRHRFGVFRDRGHRYTAITVEASEADYARATFGPGSAGLPDEPPEVAALERLRRWIEENPAPTAPDRFNESHIPAINPFFREIEIDRPPGPADTSVLYYEPELRDDLDVHNMQTWNDPEQLRQKYVRVRVPLTDLISAQDDFSGDHLSRLLRGERAPLEGDVGLPLVTPQSSGAYSISDGNHRAIAAYMRGDESMEVMVYTGEMSDGKGGEFWFNPATGRVQATKPSPPTNARAQTMEWLRDMQRAITEAPKNEPLIEQVEDAWFTIRGQGGLKISAIRDYLIGQGHHPHDVDRAIGRKLNISGMSMEAAKDRLERLPTLRSLVDPTRSDDQN